MAGAAAGLVWSAPQVANAAVTPVGSPRPTGTTEVEGPPEIEANVAVPAISEETLSEGRGPDPEAPLSILGLASTGADIATTAATGVASLSAGAMVHRAGKRRRAAEGPDEVGLEEAPTSSAPP